jgi:hypothetical protein
LFGDEVALLVGGQASSGMVATWRLGQSRPGHNRVQFLSLRRSKWAFIPAHLLRRWE